jgi:protein-tyrosine phosphatase
MNILMVCLGNICRSPMAEGLLQKKLKDAGLDAIVRVDSCGFEAFHLEEPPYYQAIQTAKNHEIDISAQRQRLFSRDDFDIFDKIYVMDSGNYDNVKKMARNDKDMYKVDYLRNVLYPGSNRPVADPWGGTDEDFEHAFQRIDEACTKIVEQLKTGML